MSKTMIVVKGTSGTGKGTRVAQVLEFLLLQHTNFVVEFTHTAESVEGKPPKKPKTRPLGICFPELNLIFVGCYTKSNKSGLTSWTSMDYLHASVGKGEIAREILKGWVNQGFTLVCEGEALLQSDKWRPAWMFDYYGLDNLSIIYFNYKTREQYDERIVGRSGKKAGDSGWSRNESYAKEFQWCLNEMAGLGYKLDTIADGDVVASTPDWSEFAICSHDAPLHTVGNLVLRTITHQFMGRFPSVNIPWTIQDFYEFCNTKPLLRSIGHADPLAGRVPDKPAKVEVPKPIAVLSDPKPKSVSLLERIREARRKSV